METLETERLILRPINKDDASDIFEYGCEPNVGPAAGWKPHQNIKETRAIMKAVFIDKDNNMRSYEVDNMLLKYIKNEDISYVMVSNDFVVNVVSRCNNKYYEYLIKELLIKI